MDPPRSSLCPGYTQVTSFSLALSSPKSRSPTLDYDLNALRPESNLAEEEGEVDYEEEVEYVTLDLGNIEPTLVPSSSGYRLIGLDTSTPFLQLSGTILRGRHDNLLGTELIFTDDKDSTSLTTAGSGPKKRGVTHVATTSKRISFKEVQLRPKDKTPAATTQPSRPEEGGGSIVLDEEGFMEEDEEGLEYAGNVGGEAMDVDDDTLEYVNFNQQNQPEAGPSRQPPSPPPAPAPASPASSSPPPSPSPSAPFASFLSSVVIPTASHKGKDKASLGEPSTSLPDVDEAPSDPAFSIDRLAGISPPLTRAPRVPKKVAATNLTATDGGSSATPGSSGPTTAREKGKGKQKTKGKQKEKDA